METVVVLSESPKGVAVSVDPRLVPSSLYWTLEVPDEALTERRIVPETVELEAGEVIEILGGVEPLLVVLALTDVEFPPHGGKAVLLLNGEAMTQVFGRGGICGGGNFCDAGDSAVCAAASKVLFVEVTVPQPPPLQ